MAVDETVHAVMGGVIEQLKQQSRVSKYYDDPVLFAKDVLGIHLWSKQREVVAAIANDDHVAVKSCHGSGKSLLASVLAAWWIATRPVGEAIVIWTAPTYNQVHAIISAEIRKHIATAEQRYREGKSLLRIPGHLTQSDQWKTDDGTLIGQGRKPADNNAHGFHGIHRRFVFVIVDESCGIPENLFTGVEAITTTEGSRILSIGNPDDPVSTFKKMFTTDANWTRLSISAFDSPNFTKNHLGHYSGCDDSNCLKNNWALRADMDKDIPEDLKPLLIQESWVDQRRVAWGEDSPLWMSKILGEFPLQSVNTLFSADTLSKGQDCEVTPLRSSKIILGVDLARFGPDYSTIYKYEEGPAKRRVNDDGDVKLEDLNKVGGQLKLIDYWGGKADEQPVDGMESAARVHQWAQSLGAHEVRIDSEGVGGPILDQIVRLADGAYTVIAMRGSSRSPDPYRWINARAYWYDSARERMMNNEIDIDPADKKLIEELEQIQYHFKNRLAVLQIESKEEMAKRGLKSPDYADAAMYAMADMTDVINDPLSSFGYGDRISMSSNDFLGLAEGAGLISPY
jgi:hypothetical protein